MKRWRIVILFAVLVIGLSAAANSFAEERTGGYIVIKPGAFIPTNDLEHKGFDNSFSGEITVGTYYNPHVELEACVGYFQTEASINGSDYHEKDDLWVIPVTINIKGVIPFKGGEFNAGVGPGIYFANIEADGFNTESGDYSNDAHSTVGEAHVVAGLNFDITKKIFLGAEGKYSITTGAHMLGTSIKLNGFTVSGVLGYRF